MLTSNIPMRMSGAIPNLKNKGAIEVFKKRTSRWASKKENSLELKVLGMALRKEHSLTRANIVGKRRSKMRIIADILRHAQRSAKKTHIMYECNLSFNQLKRYLNFLRKRALIRRKIENGSIIYKTTDNGKEFLKKYSSIAQQLRPPALERS